MIRKYLSSEKGQASVLLALALIGLLGFTALAIDGGMVYANRRHMQNASDAASLAGGSAAAIYLENHYVDYAEWNCSDPRVLRAMFNSTSGAEIVAKNSAAVNGYSIDFDLTDQNGVDADCIQGQNNGSWIERFIDVKTLITSDTPTAFAHFVYSGPLRNTVEAVARVYPRIPLAYGNAIVALARDCDSGGIEFDGSNVVEVTGGGIFSNSCIDTRGGVSVSVYGNADDNISCVLPDCYDDHGASGSVSPPPIENTGVPLPPETYEIPPPNCTGLPSHGNYNGDGTIEAGQYTQIRIQNGDHAFDPGLYCVSGDVEINGGIVAGSDVTFYVINGNFHTSGNATTSLIAPPATNCGDPCDVARAIPGVLIFLAPGNTNEATLLGTEDSLFRGLVYAPSGTIEAGGTSSLMKEIFAQLIGNDVKVHGNTNVVVTFNDKLVYQIPATIELNK
jgi:hypothetical protein